MQVALGFSITSVVILGRSSSAPTLVNDDSDITATARRSPAPVLVNDNSNITAEARR